MKRKRVKLPASGVIVLWFITYYSHTQTHTLLHTTKEDRTHFEVHCEKLVGVLC